MSCTLVPAFDHVADADLCNKWDISDQSKRSISVCEDSQMHTRTGLGWNRTSFRRGVSPHNEL